MFKANNRNTRTATFEQVNVSWGGTFFFEAFIRAIHVIIKSATLKKFDSKNSDCTFTQWKPTFGCVFLKWYRA